ncbi:MAG: sugar phosphate isomerase/epimerase [Oscillospiraceae bacterium]|nr:sugar phosphate isomerase/epimerase [Oscillospiraceae bacterium]
MKIGALFNLNESTNIRHEFEKVREQDLQTCQVCVWNPALYTEQNAKAIKEASQETGVTVSTLWAGWSGPSVWNFHDGPLTLGLVPVAYRAHRLKELMAASDFALQLGVVNIATHVGFLPENPNDADYIGVIAALRSLVQHFKSRGQYFLFETGQETPTTLVRAIEDIGTDNVGINFDTANLILYGKAASLDAVELFGKYVRDVHCKDGLFPTGGHYLGQEVPLGQGKANIEAVVKHLLSIGYKGSLTIEREISGEEQIRDIIAARNLLRRIIDEVD